MNINPYRSPTAETEEQRQSIKVKAYGLVPLTRNAYLTLQIVMVVACVALLIGIRPMVAKPGHLLGFVDDYFVTIIIAMFVLEGIETVVMLAKFKKARRGRAQQMREE